MTTVTRREDELIDGAEPSEFFAFEHRNRKPLQNKLAELSK
jgi:hypothetical protein